MSQCNPCELYKNLKCEEKCLIVLAVANIVYILLSVLEVNILSLALSKLIIFIVFSIVKKHLLGLPDKK